MRDVLRSKSDRPRTIIIDDYENIEQAVLAGIKITEIFIVATADTATQAVAAQQPALTALKQLDTAELTVVTMEPTVAKTLFTDAKHVRLFALAAAPKLCKLSALAATQERTVTQQSTVTQPHTTTTTERATTERFGGDIVVLDGVRIVGNIGAVIRTACALGARGVVLLNSGLRTVTDRRLVRASRGLVFRLPVVLATPEQFAQFVQTQQLPVATLALDGAEPLPAIRQVQTPLALVFGSERTGVSRETTALARHKYVIPMDARVESLNVSVTAGITLYLRSLTF